MKKRQAHSTKNTTTNAHERRLKAMRKMFVEYKAKKKLKRTVKTSDDMSDDDDWLGLPVMASGPDDWQDRIHVHIRL